MKQILCVNKPFGYTPLQVIKKIKQQFPEYAEQKISYAGRLDPMADGLLVLLVGEENKNRQAYESLPKIYNFSILFGVATDSYDLLGKITTYSPSSNPNTIEKKIKHLFPSLKGTLQQTYPPFSSRTVAGKPLYWWARQMRLAEIDIPKKQIEIYNITLHKVALLRNDQLHKTIKEKIEKITGNFRQEEILATWEEFFSKNVSSHFPLATMTVACSSGTYVRSLVQSLGEKIEIPTTTYAITRTNVGSFDLDNAISLDSPDNTLL